MDRPIEEIDRLIEEWIGQSKYGSAIGEDYFMDRF
jgi:hypothetical protein